MSVEKKIVSPFEGMRKMLGKHSATLSNLRPNTYPLLHSSTDLVAGRTQSAVPATTKPNLHQEPQQDEAKIVKWSKRVASTADGNQLIKSGSMLFQKAVRTLGSRPWIRVSCEVYANGTIRIYQSIPSVDISFNLDGCLVQDCKSTFFLQQRNWMVKIFAFQEDGSLVKKVTLRSEKVEEKDSWLAVLRSKSVQSTGELAKPIQKPASPLYRVVRKGAAGYQMLKQGPEKDGKQKKDVNILELEHMPEPSLPIPDIQA